MDKHPAAPNNPYLAPRAAVEDVVDLNEVELADRLTRLNAVIVDGLIQLFVILLLLSPFVFAAGFANLGAWIVEHPFLWSVLTMILGIVVFLAINFRLLRDHGQTVGKRICKIRIVRSDGTPADVQRILLYRYLPTIVIAQIPYFGGLYTLVDALLIFRESRQCLHDTIADTIVVKA